MATESCINREQQVSVSGRGGGMVMTGLVILILKSVLALDHLALNSGGRNQRSEDLKSISSLERGIKRGFESSYFSI